MWHYTDGVLQAPIMTADLHAPYRINVGTDETPHYARFGACWRSLFSQMLTPLVT